MLFEGDELLFPVILMTIIGGIFVIILIYCSCKICLGSFSNNRGKKLNKDVERGSLEDPTLPVGGSPNHGDGEGYKLQGTMSPKVGEEHCMSSGVLVQGHSSDSPSSSRYHTTIAPSEREECDVIVEVHPTTSGEDISSENSPQEGLTAGHMVGSPCVGRRSCVDSTSGLSSPLGVVLEWVAEQEGEEKDGDEVSVPSTDLTTLETSLDFWRREHARHPHLDDEEPCSKVRYNDTGSLEEVSVEQMIEYYVEDHTSLTSETDHESLKLQYRQIWELRATLEDDESLSEPSIPSIRQIEGDLEMQINCSQSSPDQSPDVESGTSEPLLEDPPRQTYRNVLSWRMYCSQQDDTSFDSVDTVDTEGSSTDASRLEQATASFESTTDNTDSTSESQAHRLQQLRADSGYRSLENPPNAAPKLSRRQAPLGDSAELDNLPVSNSTKLTHRQMRQGDSAELEIPSVSVVPKLSRHQTPLGDSAELDVLLVGTTPKPNQRLMTLGDSAELDAFAAQRLLGTNSGQSEDLRETSYKRHKVRPVSLGDSGSGDLDSPPEIKCEPEQDEGVAGLQSPPTGDPPVWEKRRKSYGRSASKKRREFVGGRRASPLIGTDLDHHYQRCYAIHNATRDYSVDEKSDALFREFSRCDPTQPDVPARQRLGGTGYRSHHSRHSQYLPYPYSYPDPSRNFS